MCCTEDFETKAAYNGMGPTEWKDEQIQFYHVPMQDFTGEFLLIVHVTCINCDQSSGQSLYSCQLMFLQAALHVNLFMMPLGLLIG